MDLEVHVYHHFPQEEDDSKLDTILRLLRQSATREKAIMADLTEAAAEAAALSDTVDSALVVLDSIADQLEAAENDPAEVAALAANIRASRTKLAEGIASPGTEDPVPDPEPEPEG